MNRFKKELILSSIVRKSAEDLVKQKVNGFESFDTDLLGMCAICSSTLKTILNQNDMSADLAQCNYLDGAGHCLVDCGDHCLDVTLTQFGIKEKVVVIKKDSEMFNRFVDMKIVRTKKDFKLWPLFQKPSKRVIDTIIEHSIDIGALDSNFRYKIPQPFFKEKISII